MHSLNVATRATRFILPLIAGFSFVDSAKAAMNSFVEIRAAAPGRESCLAANADRSISLQPCRGTDEQLWISDGEGTQWSFIRNKATNQTTPGMCLFVSRGASLRMEQCHGAEWTSQRQWKMQRTDGGVVLSSKVFGDFGRPNYLQAGEDGHLSFGVKGAATTWVVDEPVPYTEIIRHTDRGQLCLTLDEGSSRVSLRTCSGSDRQMWVFRSTGSPWWFVKNKALAQQRDDRCLYAAANGLSMQACSGSGYTSQRFWRMVGPDGGDGIQNKFIGDYQGHGRNYLQGDADGRLVFGQRQDAGAAWSLVSRYGYLRNVGQGQASCLALSADGVNVGFAPCRSEPRQDWDFVLHGAGSNYHLLKNRALASAAKPQCLGHDLKMTDCYGRGYSSMRAWSLGANRNPKEGVSEPGAIIRNKYRDDLNRGQILGAEKGVVAMVPAGKTANATWDYQWSLPLVPTRRLIGNKRALLLHAQWSNSPATDFQAVRRAVFGGSGGGHSLAEAIQISSGGKATLTGDAVTGFNLGPRPGSCAGHGALKDKAIRLAKQRGYDAAMYDFVFFETPAVSCSWAGSAANPGNWILAQGSGHKPWMWQHEVGHNLGAPHASSLQYCPRVDGAVRIGAFGCRATSAGDPSDTMNGGGSRLYPLPYLYYAGWLSDEQVPEASNGVYTLMPLFGSSTAPGVKGLRILRSDGSYLMLEFRQPVRQGFEDWKADDPFVKGVVVRVVTFSQTQVRNQLVDTTPESKHGMADAPLMPGQSVDDVLSGKRITVTEVTEAGATVRIADV